jgi:hypothetical protein
LNAAFLSILRQQVSSASYILSFWLKSVGNFSGVSLLSGCVARKVLELGSAFLGVRKTSVKIKLADCIRNVVKVLKSRL